MFSHIQTTAELQWSSLPQHFRLEMPMKSYDRPAAELDLMLGAKLNHLHVLFLQRLELVRRVSEPDAQLRNIAQEILGLVVEAVLFKDHLVHSGTSLTWKVRQHPARLRSRSMLTTPTGGILRSSSSRCHLFVLAPESATCRT